MFASMWRPQQRLLSHPCTCIRWLAMGRKKPTQHDWNLFGEVNERGGYAAPVRESLTFEDKLKVWRYAWLDIPSSAAQIRDYYLYERIPFKPVDVRHTDFYYVANFQREPRQEDWIVTRDSDYGEGFSTGEFVATPQGTGLFRGELSTRVPQTGILERAGYVNVRSPYAAMIMGRPRPINLVPMNCVVIRYRGDGRKYMLNVHKHPLSKIDMNFFDMYTFPLYSRGGPYWTVCKIPMSKLYRVYKGRIQPRPVLNDLSAHQHLSITISERTDGPFSLEIDYIAFYYDATLNERLAYEVYAVSSMMKNNITS